MPGSFLIKFWLKNKMDKIKKVIDLNVNKMYN
ncbi:hypothetical protein P549_02732 [Staphylococcus aureus M1408]|nr:hypothetical protein P549_02732 [Staphylococcus aureus M1408]EVT57812.1 hypothetical protein Q595_02032 [Staphylococcus aureus M1550]